MDYKLQFKYLMISFSVGALLSIQNTLAQTAGIQTLESFDYADNTPLDGQNGGWGWMSAWTASDAATAATYTASSTVPFVYANPSTSSYYVTPGRMNGNNAGTKIIGRYLNTNSAAGNPYSSWIDASGSIVVPIGSALYFGVLIRKDVVTDDKETAFGISDGLSTENINNGISIGYFGPVKSMNNGVRYWTIKYYNGTDYVYFLTGIPMVALKNEFFILEINNSAGGFRVWNSPVIQNGFSAAVGYVFNIPAFKFRSVFYCSEGSGSIDEIRIIKYPNMNIALMYGPTQGMTGVNDPGTGVPGAPMVTPDNNKWKLDGNSGTDPVYQFIGNTDAQDLKIRTNNLERITVAKDGNVGIGTTTPSQKLEVAGTAKVTKLLFPDGTFMTTASTGFSSGNLTLSPLSATDNNAYISTNGVGTGLIFETPDAGTSIGVPRMAITNNGSIGIGTTTPASALQVVGDLFVSKANSPAYSTGYSSKLKFDDGDMQGSDPLWIARYNTAYNQSELRINIGDDPNGSVASMDKLVIGSQSWVDNSWNSILTVSSNGEINTSSHIRIGGKVLSQDVKVVSNPLSADFPDYVFKKGYKLETLSDIEAYIKANGHLKEVPSAKEVQEDGGFELGKINVLLLKKVEELTLYSIDLNKNVELLKKMLNGQQDEINALKKRK